MRIRLKVLVLTWIFCGTGALGAQSPAELEFFEKKIRPVLVEHCYGCHSDGAKKQKGGLRLDTRDGLRKGGDSGSALIPGKLDDSLLIKAIRYADDDLKMPPKGKLSPTVIADLEAWVAMGAPDPRTQAAAVPVATNWDDMLRTRRTWWSLQPVQKIDLPAAKNAAKSEHPVDRFLLAKLDAAGLSPPTAAEPRTLIRRLNLVLNGLPPTTAEVDQFVKAWDRSSAKQQVVEELVDRSLRSLHFGERWARHWMDVVRFSETHGNEWNYDVHHAWRYRDYLIRAFNDDVPFDQLIREHIAGDLLPPRWNKKDRINDALIGTAFYRFGEVNHDDCIGLPTLGYDILDNQIDTLSKAFQATTVACARCHDHKIDAVSMKDYYALLGILRSSRPVSHTIDDANINQEIIGRLHELKAALRVKLASIWLNEVVGLDEKRLDAIKVDKTTWDHPLHPWRLLREAKNQETGGTKLANEFRSELQRRLESNVKNYVSFGDFRGVPDVEWRASGLGMKPKGAAPGDFTVSADAGRLMGTILPAGRFTHALSEKLNGTLRSPILPTTKKRISFQVQGQKQAAVRLVSNNCQLNYRNFKALKSSAWHWITFDVPDDADALRCYAELMTKFDNPKYPDQLGQLGGDDTNQRVPWDKAASDPHSYFGVTRVVLHDLPQPPEDDLAWLASLYSSNPPDRTALAVRYRERALHAVRAWADDKTTDADVRWLDWLLQQGVLSNNVKVDPGLSNIASDYRALENQLVMPRIVPGLADVDDGIAQPVFIRGDCKKPGDPVARRYLEVLTPPTSKSVSQGSGRRQLADAIASPTNPLTARVMVNRIWHHVFGQGLVRSTDDFGRMGDLPTHPEMLDWLAQRFIDDGWSVKKMIRLLVTSQAFQMSNRADAKAAEIDPLNRLLHHYPARRLEAEAIRDSILATSGRLDRTLYGLSVLPFRESTNEDRRLFPGPLDGNGRRSLYIKVNLMEGPRFLSAFDLPGGKVCQGKRDVTNVPAQALALLNDPFVVQQAEFWAKRLVQRPTESVSSRIEHIIETALGRTPSETERERMERFVGQLAEVHQVSADRLSHSTAVWHDVAHALFNLQEFVYIP